MQINKIRNENGDITTDTTAVEYILFKVSNTIKIMFGRKLYSEDERISF